MIFFFYIYLTSDGHANTIISRRVWVIIWCPECWKWHLRASRFLNFLGEHAPRPPRLRDLTTPCSYSRLLFSNQLPTSNFIETPGYSMKHLRKTFRHTPLPVHRANLGSQRPKENFKAVILKMTN